MIRKPRQRSRRGTRAAATAIAALGVSALATGQLVPAAAFAEAAGAADSATPPQPVVEYTFDDAGPGVTTLHNSGSGGAAYDGTVVNASALGTGTRNGAGTLALPGGANKTDASAMPYVQIPNGIYNGVSGITISTWVNWDGKYDAPGAAPWAFILGGDKLASNNYGVFFAPSESGKLSVAANDGPEFKANTADALPANTWQQLTITEDGSNLDVYVNGLEVESVPSSIDFSKLYSADSTYSGLIGRTQWTDPWASFFGGQLDDFQVYNSALTSDQVATLADATPTMTGLASDTVSVTTYPGEAPSLPATVDATYTDGIDRPIPATWDAVDPNSYASTGTFTVHGTASGQNVTATVTVKAAPQIDVDASKVIRPVTHVGAGGLYALATDSEPDPKWLTALHLNQLTQPAPGVTQLGNGATVPTGDALKVASSMIGAGAQETVRMPDIYPDFPYHWVSWSDWLSKVDTMVQARTAATDVTNINGWELWNEPDGTWDTADAGSFTDGWTRTYQEVRKYDTVTPIVGPSISSYNHAWMLNFLTQAKAAGTLPDVISWHEWNIDSLPSQISDLEGIEDSLGIAHRPISINEYAWTDQVDKPSSALHYLATFERATAVRDAERAYWYESGTVNGLLYNDKPTGTYWLYKWYGDMTGNMVSVTQNGSEDGMASLDSTRKVLNVVVGGGAGSNVVHVHNLQNFGSTAHVTLSYTPNSGRKANVDAPTTVWSGNLPITDGVVDVPITNQNADGAYDVTVTPQSGPTTASQETYEAENATIVNGQRKSAEAASNGGYVSDLTGTGDERSDSFVDFIVDAPTAGKYDLGVKYANADSSSSSLGLAVNGGDWSTVSFPSTGATDKFTTVNAPAVTLKAGYNVIRLAKGSPGFVGGNGTTELDAIDVVPASSTTPPVGGQVATAMSVKAAPASTSFDKAVTVSVKVASSSGSTPTGSVKVTDGGKVLATPTLVKGVASVRLPVSLAVGTHTIRVAYAGNEAFAASSGGVVVTVTKAGSRTRVSVSPKKVRHGKHAAVRVKLSAPLLGGRVRLTVRRTGPGHKRVVVRRTIEVPSSGHLRVRLKSLRVGKYRVRAVWSGTASVAGSADNASFKVRR